MKTLVKFIFLLGISCLLISCTESALYEEPIPELKSANVPTSNIIGALDLYFSPPTIDFNFWNGTVDFGAEYGMYSIAFFSYPAKAEPQFEEEFIVYELGMDWSVPENVVLKARHKGRLVQPHSESASVIAIANGKITEASAPFEFCLGRTEHVMVTVFFDPGPFPTCTGTLRIN